MWSFIDRLRTRKKLQEDIVKQGKIRKMRPAVSGEQELADEIDQHMKIMQSLFEISTDISRQINLDDILQMIVKRVIECLEADYSSLQLVQEENVLKTRASYGKGAERARDATMNVGQGVAGWVAQHGSPLLLNGEVDQKAYPGMQKKERKVSSALSVPLMAEGKTIGVLNVNRTEMTRHFTRSDLQLLSIFANNAAVAIEGARLMKEFREKARLRTILEQYHSPEVVDEILRYPASGGLAEEKILTIMFADIRGFSQITRNLSTSQVKEFLDTFFSSMTKIIFECKGTVDKFIGDAIMAFFGAPLALEKPEFQCLAASREMVHNFNFLREKWRKRFPSLESIGLGIGISTGKVFIGNVGSLHRYDYTVIGEEVIIAERLSRKAMPGQILLSEKTYLSSQDDFKFQPLGRMDLLGIENAPKVYEVMLK